jgi:hypothetical protein
MMTLVNHMCSTTRSHRADPSESVSHVQLMIIVFITVAILWATALLAALIFRTRGPAG